MGISAPALCNSRRLRLRRGLVDAHLWGPQRLEIGGKRGHILVGQLIGNRLHDWILALTPTIGIQCLNEGFLRPTGDRGNAVEVARALMTGHALVGEVFAVSDIGRSARGRSTKDQRRSSRRYHQNCERSARHCASPLPLFCAANLDVRLLALFQLQSTFGPDLLSGVTSTTLAWPVISTDFLQSFMHGSLRQNDFSATSRSSS